jgi:hypothetical protein
VYDAREVSFFVFTYFYLFTYGQFV